jgi:hypothetical protein
VGVSDRRVKAGHVWLGLIRPHVAGAFTRS